MKPFKGKPYDKIANIKCWIGPAKMSIAKWKDIISLGYYSDATVDACGLCIRSSGTSGFIAPFMCRDQGCPLYVGDHDRINMNCCYHHDELGEIFDLNDLLDDDETDNTEIEAELVRLCELCGERLILYLEGLIAFAADGGVVSDKKEEDQ